MKNVKWDINCYVLLILRRLKPIASQCDHSLQSYGQIYGKKSGPRFFDFPHKIINNSATNDNIDLGLVSINS